MSTPPPYGPPGDSNNNPTPPPPPPPGGSGFPPVYAPSTEGSKDSFVNALTDLNFDRFITVKFAKLVYLLAIVLTALSLFMFIISMFMVKAWVGLLALLFGWIPAALTIILIRVGLEVSVAQVKTSENTSKLVERS